MKRFVKHFAAACVVAVFISDANAETPEEEIRRAILRLGDDDEKERAAAQVLLAEIGPEAVLLYRPNEQGKDAEIRRRMEDLMDGWEFRKDGKSAGRTEDGTRVRPWVNLEADGDSLDVEDDRLPGLLFDRVKNADSLIPACVQRSDIPLTLDLTRALVDRVPNSFAMWIVGREDLNLADGAGEFLIEILQSNRVLKDEWTSFLLFRLGQREPFLVALRGGKLELREAFDVVSLDPDVRAAVAEGYSRSFTSAEAAARFPSARFANHYREIEDAGSLARLEPGVALPCLRDMLKSKSPSVRLRTAIALAGFGEVAPDLDRWQELDLWEPDLILRAAPALPGERVEERLREMVDDPRVSLGTSYCALRGLAARKRERDITFVYTHLKELRARLQPEVAVDLARLGSAAGANVLIPRLYGTGYSIRRDANNALKNITCQDFNYNPAGTLPERCRAARKWAIWWRENRTSFHPDVK
ncbi:MAG: hypothetical protein FD180_4901 [Planctomycetota bacterium]|nr:MAG: hypothetical protein FD180_4901 [Planctomycetota bacterium]